MREFRKERILASIFKPLTAEKASLSAIDYGENKIPFGKTIGFVDLDTYREVNWELSQLKAKYEKAIEALESIACIEKQHHADLEFWKSQPLETSALVACNDTVIARQTLKELGEA